MTTRASQPSLAMIVKNAANPSSRHRALQYAPLFAERGWRVGVFDLETAGLARLRAEWAAGRYDVVFLQRKLVQPWEALILGRKPLVYDFDDAVVYAENARDGDAPSRTRERKFSALAARAALVVAGNSGLAAMASARKARRVIVAPTAVDAAGYAHGVRREDAAAAVGWIGSSSTLKYLDAFIPAYRKLRERHPSLEFVIVADRPPAAMAEGMRFVPWSDDGERRIGGMFDIGIMPLPDTPWTRGKCGFKIIQYFAAGLPVVCSPVGANREIVDEGKNGFFASTPGEWTDGIGRLVHDAALCKTMGIAARRTALERYDRAVVFETLFSALDDVRRKAAGGAA